MADIQLLHGNQTFKHSSTKVNTFVMRADKTDKRDFPNKHLEQIRGTYTAIPAALDGYKDHGMWYNTRYESKEGKILLVMASITYRGSPYSNGGMLLYLRHDAPLIKLEVANRYNANAVHQQVPVFMGRADILSLDEVEDYGIILQNRFTANYFDEEEIEEIFTVTTLNTGKPKPEMLAVRTPEGAVRKVAVPQEGARRIRIRKKNV